MTNQAHIDQLAARIKQASDAYYNGLPPLMSDAAWDALADELRKLDPTNPVLLSIGAPVPTSGPLVGGGWPKVSHVIPMGSLNKAQVEADMNAWHKGCQTNNHLVIMDKLDGGSISLVYAKRRLVQAVTRGDGIIGEDITRNALLMKGAVKMLPATIPDGHGGQTPTPDNVYVRGEVIIQDDDFKTYFPGESNPRNSANGTMKRQSDNAKCAHLTVICYNFMPRGVGLHTKSAELAILTNLGFLTPKWSLVPSIKDVFDVYTKYVNTIRKTIGYWIDGLVIEVDALDTREALGDLNGRPKGSIAFKFPHEEKTSILRDVIWQVGNSGRITPVAIFDEVILGGAKVSKASLAGVRQVEHMKLFPGCKVLISKRNDIIPRVEANLDEGIVNDI